MDARQVSIMRNPTQLLADQPGDLPLPRVEGNSQARLLIKRARGDALFAGV